MTPYQIAECGKLVGRKSPRCACNTRGEHQGVSLMRPQDSTPVEAVQIPLRARDGSVRAYVLVDADDAAWANRWQWHLDSYGYAMRNSEPVGGKRHVIYLHRELLGLTRGDGVTGDHVNRIKLDCRRSNLRRLTKAQNGQNVPGLRAASSAYRGVSWRKEQRRWAAYVTFGGKKRHLGFFTDELQAADAARQARLRHLPYSVEQGA